MKTSLLIHPEELDKRWIDRLVEFNYDTLSLHPHGGDEASKSLNELLSLLNKDEYRHLLDYAISKGLKIEYECHAMSYLLDRELFKTHPEYFRINEKGERSNDYNFCVSNQDALEIVGKNALVLAKKLYKSEHNYYIWADDNGSFCHCDKCKHLSPAEQNLIIMNKIYESIHEEIPDAKVAFLAYQGTLDTIKNVKKEEGIFLEYAPIERSFATSYISQGKDNINKIKDLLSFFGTKDSKVLEYWFDNSLFSKWKKPPKEYKLNEEVLKEDLKLYKSLGFEYISSFACYLGQDYIDLYGEPKITSLK